jgi:hypothetical protein
MDSCTFQNGHSAISDFKFFLLKYILLQLEQEFSLNTIEANTLKLSGTYRVN